MEAPVAAFGPLSGTITPMMTGPVVIHLGATGWGAGAGGAGGAGGGGVAQDAKSTARRKGIRVLILTRHLSGYSIGNMKEPVRTLPVHSENQWFQKVLALKTNRQKRASLGQFFVEGVRSINQLRPGRGAGRGSGPERAGSPRGGTAGRPAWDVDALLYTPARRLSGWARDVLAEVPAPLHLELAPALMEKLSDKEEGSEIIAVVNIPRTGLEDITPGNDGIVVVLDRPGNPGNLGSIIRSCDAFGVRGVVVFGHAVDLYDPQVIRASAGAFFSVPAARAADRAALDAWMGGLERAEPPARITGTSAKASRIVSQCDFRGPSVICFGSETMGLSAWLKERCGDLAGMPMRGTATSLNLACAVTAVLYEASRQRGAGGPVRAEGADAPQRKAGRPRLADGADARQRGEE